MTRPFDPDSSPVYPFLGNIFDSLKNVAPEKAAELDAVLRKHEVRLMVDQTPGRFFRATVRSGRREVRCSMLGAEFLWASAFAYVAIYRELPTFQGTVLTFASHPTTKHVPDMLDFAFGKRIALQGPQEAWPAHLPTPRFVKPAEEPDTVALATELWLCAIAWILHHEVAHVYLGHLEKFAQEIRDEVAADEAATDWLVVGVSNDPEKVKRSLGIAIAVSAVAGLTLHRNGRRAHTTSSTHPPSGERILRALSHSSFDENHPAQALASVAVKVHLDRFDIAVPQGPFDDPSECLEAYCRTLIDWELGRS